MKHMGTSRFVCTRAALAFTCLCVCPYLGMHVCAQLDDLADASWAAPQLDALQRLSEDPICLHCVSPTELTQIPGFGRATASRIIKVVQSGVSDLEMVADSACLSTDQRLLLFMCTTTTCTCEQHFQSMRTRMRATASTPSKPDVLARSDVLTTYGRSGAVYRNSATGNTLGGWLMATVGQATVAIGDVAISSGLGLVHGSGGAFGRSLLGRLTSFDVQPHIRAWTSTYQDGSQRGAAVHLRSPFGFPIQGLAAWSHRQVADRQETAVLASCTATLQTSTLVFNFQDLSFNDASTSRSMSIVPTKHRSLFSIAGDIPLFASHIAAEAAVDDSLRAAIVVVGTHQIDRGRVFAAMRWSHPDFRNPYAAPISSTSSLGNESGLGIGVQWRPQRAFEVESNFDIHSTLSRAYGKPLPSIGLDAILDVEARLATGLHALGRLRYEADDDGWHDDNSSIVHMLRRERITTRADITMQVTKAVRLRWRFDGRTVWYSDTRTSESGYLSFVDLEWIPTPALRCVVRSTVYTSASIESAAYALEVPIPGMSQTIAGTGTGLRMMASLRYTPTTWCTLSTAMWEHLKPHDLRVRGVVFQVDLHLSHDTKF